jgi:hypothetical protein
MSFPIEKTEFFRPLTGLNTGFLAPMQPPWVLARAWDPWGARTRQGESENNKYKFCLGFRA